jgi:imidazolonepropionase-like amidohydrolase
MPGESPDDHAPAGAVLTAHTAPVVLPMTGPPVRDGAVLVDGDRIAAVGPATWSPTACGCAATAAS